MCRPDPWCAGPFLHSRRLGGSHGFAALFGQDDSALKRERLVRRLWHISPQPRARAVSLSHVLAEANLASLLLLVGSAALLTSKSGVCVAVLGESSSRDSKAFCSMIVPSHVQPKFRILFAVRALRSGLLT
jgi:hypothetical protein